METKLIDFIGKDVVLGGFMCGEKHNGLCRWAVFKYNGVNYLIYPSIEHRENDISSPEYTISKTNGVIVIKEEKHITCDVDYQNRGGQEYIRFCISGENGKEKEILRIGVGRDHFQFPGCICECSWQNMPREDEYICSANCEFYKDEYGEGFCRKDIGLPRFCRCEGDKTQCEHPDGENRGASEEKVKIIFKNTEKIADKKRKAQQEMQQHIAAKKYISQNQGEMDLLRMGYKCIGKDSWLCADPDNSSQITMSGQWAIINENGNNQVKITYGEAKAIVKLFEERMKKDV